QRQEYSHLLCLGDMKRQRYEAHLTCHPVLKSCSHRLHTFETGEDATTWQGDGELVRTFERTGRGERLIRLISLLSKRTSYGDGLCTSAVLMLLAFELLVLGCHHSYGKRQNDVAEQNSHPNLLRLCRQNALRRRCGLTAGSMPAWPACRPTPSP